MNDLRKAAEMALEALEWAVCYDEVWKCGAAIEVLRAALAQPDPAEVRQGWEYMREKGLLQEPVAWKVVVGTGVSYLSGNPPHPSVVAACRPLYAHPPQRKPLTDELIDILARSMVKGNKSVNWLCRVIEAEHGIGGEE